MALLAIVILPFNYAYYPLDEYSNIDWHAEYVLTDPVGFGIILILFMMNIGYQVSKNSAVQIGLMSIMLLISSLISFFILSTLLMPNVDFKYSYSALISLSLGILMMLVFISEIVRSKTRRI